MVEFTAELTRRNCVALCRRSEETVGLLQILKSARALK